MHAHNKLTTFENTVPSCSTDVSAQHSDVSSNHVSHDGEVSLDDGITKSEYCIHHIGSIIATAFTQNFAQLLVSRGREDNTVYKLKIELWEYANRNCRAYVKLCNEVASECLPQNATVTATPDALIIKTTGLRDEDQYSGGEMTFIVEIGQYTQLIGPYYELEKAPNVPLVTSLACVQEPSDAAMPSNGGNHVSPSSFTTMVPKTVSNVTAHALPYSSAMVENNMNCTMAHYASSMMGNFANNIMTNDAAHRMPYGPHGMSPPYVYNADPMMGNCTNDMMMSYAGCQTLYGSNTGAPPYQCASMPRYYNLWGERGLFS